MANRDIISKGDGLREQRQQVLDKANPALKKKIQWVLTWQRNESCQGLMGKWELGEQVNDIWQDMTEGGSKTYGQGAWKQLSLFMHEDASVLNSARRLFLVYKDKKRIQEICDMTMQDGVTHISYSHMRQLLAIEDDQKRQEALNLTLLNCWTSAELGVHVQQVNGGTKSNNPRGRAAVPKDAETVISQQLAFADDFENRNIKVWKDPKYSLSAQIDDMEPEDFTEDLAAKLGVVAKRMRQLAEEATARAEEAEERHAEVLAELKTRKAKAKMIPAVKSSKKVSDDDFGDSLPDDPRSKMIGRAKAV